MSIMNLAAYRFARLDQLKPRRAQLQDQCKTWGLRGTILLSTEGINLFVAGEQSGVEALLAEIRRIPGLEKLTPKISMSEEQPFTRMLVKIKREIIAFGVEGIDPLEQPAPKLSPHELKRWLDEGRPVTLLDTRNDYEVKLGTFKNAVPIGIDQFRDFPEAVAKLPPTLKQQPIVMFCTGGIRCEKAGPFMQRQGFEQIFQLDGGILQYFEDCGGDHYEGECFVFDQRVGVDPALHETPSTLCLVCQMPLSPADQVDARYEPGLHCPHCYRSSEQTMAELLQARQADIQRVTTPLPGHLPYDNYRPMRVPALFDGARLIDFLSATFAHVPREEWEAKCTAGRLLNEAREPVDPNHRVRAGMRYLHLAPATQEPAVNADIRILYEDDAIIVVHKPAPLPMHPSGRYHRNTLQYILGEVYHQQLPRPAHRLDANTSGVVVFTRRRHFAGILQTQFARGEVEKCYLARIQGQPPEEQFRCDLPIRDAAGELGSREIDELHGLPARTDFRVLERFQDGTTLLEVRPYTGRTNQIRVHLWQLGWPICGDRAYLPGQRIGDTQTHALGDAPLCLHAWKIAFEHPQTGQRVTFAAPAPAWTTGPWH